MNNSEIVKLIGAAKYYNLLDGLLPDGVKVRDSSHSTGEHCYVYLTLPDVPELLVWYKTNWFHSMYEFNERDKVHGFQPKCDFATKLISEFFHTVEQAVSAKRAEEEEYKKYQVEQAARQETEHLKRFKDAYKHAAPPCSPLKLVKA
jgi:hypothetical protein